MGVLCDRKGWSMQWSFPIGRVGTFSTWRKNAPTSFQSSKTLGTRTNTGCLLVSSCVWRSQSGWNTNRFVCNLLLEMKVSHRLASGTCTVNTWRVLTCLLSLCRHGGCDFCWCCPAWPDEDRCFERSQLFEERRPLCYLNQGTLITAVTGNGSLN